MISLLFTHIIVSILSILGSLGLLTVIWRQLYSGNSRLIAAITVTSALSIGSGVALIAQGAGITRVCIEGGIVISLNYWLVSYHRQTIRAKT